MVEDELITEAGSDPYAGYESRPTSELVELMNAEDSSVPEAVRAAAASISEAIDAIAERLRAGGRLVYVGAGSSGLIAALDASECEATFSTPPGLVVALVAGDSDAAPLARAAAEDDRDAGARDLAALGIRTDDAVVGISASGSTPYVAGALETAATAGALTACVVCAPGSVLGGLADHEIVVVVGPEFITGSTRLKAGTATKLLLNIFTTLSMVRIGKVLGNLMVDLYPANVKLRDRAARIVQELTGRDYETARKALEHNGWVVKKAVETLTASLTANDTE